MASAPLLASTYKMTSLVCKSGHVEPLERREKSHHIVFSVHDERINSIFIPPVSSAWASRLKPQSVPEEWVYFIFMDVKIHHTLFLPKFWFWDWAFIQENQTRWNLLTSEICNSKSMPQGEAEFARWSSRPCHYPRPFGRLLQRSAEFSFIGQKGVICTL